MTHPTTTPVPAADTHCAADSGTAAVAPITAAVAPAPAVPTTAAGVARALPDRFRAVARRPHPRGRLPRRLAVVGSPADDTGMATAEYAIATVAAAGFAGLLVVILRSGEVRELLLGIVRSALSL